MKPVRPAVSRIKPQTNLNRVGQVIHKCIIRLDLPFAFAPATRQGIIVLSVTAAAVSSELHTTCLSSSMCP
jgi:hypothetical protein